MELVKELVESIILTGQLEKERSVSLCLIAPPECGKTSVVLERPCAALKILTDVTGRGLQLLCEQNKDATHFVINDLLAPQSKKHNVKQFTISMMCALTEEGIDTIAYPDGIRKIANGKRAIICSIPSTLLGDGRQWWNKSGFASRLLPFAFKHSGPLIVKVRSDIINHKALHSTGAEFPVLKELGKISLSKEYARKIDALSMKKSEELSEVGYRRLKQFLALSKAHALREHRHAVTGKDVDFLERIYPYISYTRMTEL